MIISSNNDGSLQKTNAVLGTQLASPVTAGKVDQQIPAKISSWFGKTWTVISAGVTIERVTKATAVAGALFGGVLAATAGNLQGSMEGVAFAGAAVSLTCFGGALAHVVKGDGVKAARTLAIAGALSGLVAAYPILVQKTTQGIQNSNDGAFSLARAQVNSKILLPPCVYEVPRGFFDADDLAPENRVHMRMEEVNEKGQQFYQKVMDSLRSGGRLESGVELDGSSGSYLIRNNEGRIIALFKPEDERNWGPQHRNESHRRNDPSVDDISFHEMSSFEQGQASKRQLLAELLDFGQYAHPPQGAIVEITSDRFVDVEAERLGIEPRKQTKSGYLQEWISGAKTLADLHPSAVGLEKPPEEAYHFAGYPVLVKAPLEEFQKIGIMDVILYNEDRHPGNILVTQAEGGEPHLVPIDSDAVLPWKTENLVGIYVHENAEKPFTAAMLNEIEKLDPNYVLTMVKSVGLPEQAAANAKILTMVVKKYASSGGTLADIYRFISKPAGSSEGTSSPLWHLVKRVRKEAIDLLSEGDKGMYEYYHHLRWVKWFEKDKPFLVELQTWWNEYSTQHAARIEKLVEDNFWKLINESL